MKRILLVVAAIAAVATAAVWFAAQESYVTTVKARVGTGLNVSTHGSQNYGLVFGQEERIGSMKIEINAKAKADSNRTGVQYTIACNYGPSGSNAGSICPNLVISPVGSQKLVVCATDPDTGELIDPDCNTQEQSIQWLFTAPDCEDAAQKKDDPKTVPCSQDKNWFLSGEVSIDVDGYQGSLKELVCNKKTDTFWNVFGGGDTGIACVVGGAPQGPEADD